MEIREEKIEDLSFLSDEKTFLDIESSGLHPERSYLLMAGTLKNSSKGGFLRQIYLTSKDPSEEKSLLQALFMDPFSSCVTFNGAFFDLPFLKVRTKKNQLTFPFTDIAHEDLYLWLRERKKFFSFPSLKLENLAEAAGFERKGHLSGKGASAAASSMDQKEVQEALLLHNKEDLLSLAYLYRMTRDLKKSLTLIPSCGPLMGVPLELQRAWIEKDFGYGEFSFSSLPSNQLNSERRPALFPVNQKGAFSSSFGDISWTEGQLTLRINVYPASTGKKEVFLAAFPQPISDASPYSLKAPLFVFGDRERFYFENILSLVKLLLESYQ